MHNLLRKLWHAIDNGGIPGIINFVSGLPEMVNISSVSQDLICGASIDGAITLDGNTGTVPTGFSISGSGSSAVYTMSKHIMASSMTISSGITLKPAGHFLKVKGDLTLGNNVTIQANGNGGGTGLNGASPPSSGFFSGGSAGGNGKTQGQAGAGGAGSSVIGVKLGGTGGTGGTTPSGAGGAGSSTNNWVKSNGDKFVQAIQGFFISGTSVALLGGGSGGGGGGGVTNTYSNPGGGGSGAGVIVILVGGTITYGSNCRITAIGGAGKDAYNSSIPANTRGGGGGGGGGGAIFVRSKRKIGSVTFDVSGGAGGNKVSSSDTNGSAGSSGYYKEVYLL